MTKLTGQHYLCQFDRYPTGPERELAMCNHMALLQNANAEQDCKFETLLTEVLDFLRQNMFVAAALAIAKYQEPERDH